MQKTWLLIQYIAARACGAFSWVATRRANRILVEYTHLKYGTRPVRRHTHHADCQIMYDTAFGRAEEPSNDEMFSGPIPVGYVKMFSSRTV